MESKVNLINLYTTKILLKLRATIYITGEQNIKYELGAMRPNKRTDISFCITRTIRDIARYMKYEQVLYEGIVKIAGRKFTVNTYSENTDNWYIVDLKEN